MTVVRKVWRHSVVGLLRQQDCLRQTYLYQTTRRHTLEDGNFIVRNWFIGASSAKQAVKTDIEAVLCLFPTADTETESDKIRFFSLPHCRTSRILSGGFRGLYGNTRPEREPDRLCPPSVDEECVPLCQHSVCYALIIYCVRHEHLWFMVSPCCCFCSFASQCM